MASASERLVEMALDEFPWGFMIEILDKFTFRELVNFQDNVEAVVLPRMLGSLLKRNGVIRGEDLMLLNEKNPNMFTNAKFLRCIPDTVNIEEPKDIDEDKWENVLGKAVYSISEARSKL